MEGPTETAGNGDSFLDPGESWQYRFVSTITRDSWVEVAAYGDPEHSPGTHFGPEPARSKTVTVGPDTLPRTGSDPTVTALVALVLLGLASAALMTRRFTGA